MANNIQVKDAAGSTIIVKTTDNGGVHTPSNNIDSFPADPFGAIADAAVVTNTTGTISGKLRGLVAWAYGRMPAALGQTTKSASLPVVLASDQDALAVSAIAAGENHLGSVGGTLKVISVVPVINPAIYASADVIGTQSTIASITRVAAGSCTIRSAVLSDKAKQSAGIDVLLFDVNPASSTFTDNAAIDVNAADLAKLIGIISFVSGDYVAFASTSAAMKQGLNIGISLASGSSIYAVFVSRGAPHYTSVSDLNLRIAVEQN